MLLGYPLVYIVLFAAGLLYNVIPNAIPLLLCGSAKRERLLVPQGRIQPGVVKQ